MWLGVFDICFGARLISLLLIPLCTTTERSGATWPAVVPSEPSEAVTE